MSASTLPGVGGRALAVVVFLLFASLSTISTSTSSPEHALVSGKLKPEKAHRVMQEADSR
jgi:hypothetical protein